MLRTLKAAWRAGRSGQPMPQLVDKSTGQTVAVVSVFGMAVIAVFGTAYAIGSIEKKRREEEARRLRGEDDDELKKLAADAEAAKRELSDETDVIVDDEEEEEYITPPGSAACPHCNSVHLDADDAAECCPERRGYEEDPRCKTCGDLLVRAGDDEYCPNCDAPTFEQDHETGEITDPQDAEEPEGVEDLWGDHLNDEDSD